MKHKQQTNSNSSSSSSCGGNPLFPTSAMDDQILVSHILLDLKTLMSLSESLSDFNWTRRKRRSCLDAHPPLLPALSLPPQSIHDKIHAGKPPTTAADDQRIKKILPAAHRTTASPDTPLSFGIGGESDNHSCKKRKRNEYIDMVRGLNQQRDLLRGKIENVKKCYHKLKTLNSALKAVKQEVLNSCTRKGETQMERMNSGMEFTQHYRMNMVLHLPPLVGDPTAQRSVNHLGQQRFDLNMPADDVDASQPLDVIADRRARFAEARRKRRGIIKIKAMRNGCGLKFPVNR